MKKYFVKFSYIGFMFSGFQRGNGENSVEDSIINALKDAGMANEIHSAARTDRGVSATGNVFSVETDSSIEKVMGILNSKVKNCAFHSYAAVDTELNPRHNRMKQYRYYLPDMPEKDKFSEFLMKFRGEHDFSGFCRKDNRNPVRTIQEISTSWMGDYGWIDFYGKSFVWNQIRSIVGFSLSHLHEEEMDPFRPGITSSYIAPAENLVLMDIMYDGINFTSVRNSSKVRYISKMNDQYFANFHAMDTISKFLHGSVFNEKIE